MPSEIDANGLAEARPAFKAFMMRNALYGSTELDVRTVTVMQKNGLLSKVPLNPLPSGIVDILTSPLHPLRVSSPLGPLLFVREEESRMTVMHALDFLLSHDRNVRRAALSYFASLAALSPKVLTPKSEELVVRAGEDAVATDPEMWRSAALKIVDGLKDDFLCNLAGVRQSLEMRFDAGMNRYLPLVLQPPISSIDSIYLQFPTPCTQIDELSAFVQEVLGTSVTLSEAINRYYDACGHLPLAESLSMGRIVREWVALHDGRDEVWEQIWSWADHKASPLARYHACQTFCVNPELVPPQRMSTLWAELTDIVHIPKTEDADRQTTQTWRVRCELARHYTHYLENQLPGREGDRLAVLAWWMAETVASVFGTASETVKRVREIVIIPAEEQSSQMWQLVHPPIQPSILCYGTIRTTSVWSLGLQSQLSSLIQHTSPEQREPATLRLLQSAILASVMRLFPHRHRTDVAATYAFENSVIPTAKLWSDAVATGEDKEMLNAFIQLNERLSHIDRFDEYLGMLPKANETDQFLLAEMVRIMAYLDETPLDVVWEHLADATWRDGILLKGNYLALALLFEAWTELQVRQGDKWSFQLPHYYALACESASGDTDRQELLFEFTVLSSIASDTVSGLDHLLHGKRKQDFAKSALDWRTRLEYYQTAATPWIAARIRAILTSLRGAG